ncbi:hypothetical protein PRUPE_4G133100 [Prunus persica]|uniref:25S rRNA (uridine-N(3))-methyltransferase BMT5-like domain-containing protein n=1 Tax=Prunus persica TaxID=3760 RepID=M5X919_PRUPE|nr:hypothetical protein PRUPE_4G133100 [Prunus persica]
MELFGYDEKRIKHYRTCLARAFGSAANMVATSLDSREELMVKYSKALRNLRELENRGCKIFHGLDMCTPCTITLSLSRCSLIE